MSYELKDFRKDVIEASEESPVVIDFWAEWCGPCRQLSPVLEKLAGEARGTWKFVKINTDQHPEIAGQFNVRGIPAVKMVYQKQIIAEFTGAQPEHAVRKWLSENLPENGKSESDELLEQVNMLLSEGNRKDARNLLRKSINSDTPAQFRVRLAMLLLPGQPDEAQSQLEKVGDEIEINYEIEQQTLETVFHLNALKEGKMKPEGDNEKAKNLYLNGIEALFNEEFEEALQNFIECIMIDRQFDDDGARKAAVACFTMLGDSHPISQKYRRRFSMALY